MSKENVELWRASIEAEFSFRAGTSEFDPEATISKMAELWDSELQLDLSEFEGPDVGGVLYSAFGSSGESGLRLGKPSNSSTSCSTPGTASSCCWSCGCAVALQASRWPWASTRG